MFAPSVRLALSVPHPPSPPTIFGVTSLSSSFSIHLFLSRLVPSPVFSCVSFQVYSTRVTGLAPAGEETLLREDLLDKTYPTKTKNTLALAGSGVSTNPCCWPPIVP